MGIRKKVIITIRNIMLVSESHQVVKEGLKKLNKVIERYGNGIIKVSSIPMFRSRTIKSFLTLSKAPPNKMLQSTSSNKTI